MSTSRSARLGRLYPLRHLVVTSMDVSGYWSNITNQATNYTFHPGSVTVGHGGATSPGALIAVNIPALMRACLRCFSAKPSSYGVRYRRTALLLAASSLKVCSHIFLRSCSVASFVAMPRVLRKEMSCPLLSEGVT